MNLFYKKLQYKVDRKKLIYLIIILGVILRVVQYLYNRSIWLDESFVALNVINRSFLELFKPLDYNLSVPIGFLFIEKFLILIFGNSEYILRFFPLICGIASVFLFYKVIKIWIGDKPVIPALILFVFSVELIYYSSEARQYSSDVFISTFLLVVFAIYNNKVGLKFSDIIAYGVIGALAIWISFTSIFLLSGLALGLLVVYLLNKDYNKIKYLFSVSFIWIMSFILNFFVSLKSLSRNQDLLESFKYDFMPLAYRSFYDFFWFFKAFYKFFRFALGLPALRSILGWHNFVDGVSIADLSIYSFSYLLILASFVLLVLNIGGLFILGGRVLFLNKRRTFLILISPFLVSLFISGLRLYPFVGRTNIFLLPITFIFVGEGVLFLCEKTKFKIINLLSIVFLFLYPVLSAGYHLIKPIYVEEIRPVLECIDENWQDGDLLYVYNNSKTAFIYYYELKDLKRLEFIYGSLYDNELVDWEKESEKLIGKNRVWFLVSHNYEFVNKSDEENLLNYFDKKGIRIESYKKKGASVYLYNFK